MFVRFSAALIVYVLLVATPVKACLTAMPSSRQLVTNTEVIVRATAVGYLRAPQNDVRELNTLGRKEIEFKVEEVLRGQDVPSTLIIDGYLSDKDDFNDRPVPYDFIRKSGRHGSCHAYEYKQGAEYLLFLKQQEGRLTPYWYALAPANEQLHSANDPWLAWVRSELEALKEKENKTEPMRALETLKLNVAQLLSGLLTSTI